MSESPRFASKDKASNASVQETGATLQVRDLIVEIPTRHGILRPVNGISYDLAPGEILGVVGESGAGKSMTGNAVIGLLDRPAHIASGEIRLKGRNIENLSPRNLRQLRGKEIGMVFQDPLTSLNPLIPIGEQLSETIQTHLGLSSADSRKRAQLALEEVGIPAAAERLDSYPHEFSGGMRQRVVIALALCAEPALVIADEPTTALDVSVQAQIITLLKRLCRDHGTSVILVTHDMGVIAEAADRVAVMYAGQLVEIGPVRNVLTDPSHPYTDGLVGSMPVNSHGQSRLRQIPGAMPRLDALPDGCPFNPRCQRADAQCRADPRPVLRDGVACWHPLEVGT
ncbi:MAG: ABC transporter ATP-binding protein [Pseudomonadota bacterium]